MVLSPILEFYQRSKNPKSPKTQFQKMNEHSFTWQKNLNIPLLSGIGYTVIVLMDLWMSKTHSNKDYWAALDSNLSTKFPNQTTNTEIRQGAINLCHSIWSKFPVSSKRIQRPLWRSLHWKWFLPPSKQHNQQHSYSQTTMVNAI